MGVSTYGWLEAREIIGEHNHEWVGVIKIGSVFAGIDLYPFREALFKISTQGMPADASTEVKEHWKSGHYTNCSLLVRRIFDA